MIEKNIKLYIQLLEVFSIREIKSRYKASLLGPVWIILYPLASAIILNLVFGIFIKIKTDNIPFFIFLLSGLIFWNFFQQGFNLGKDSLIWNRELVVKTAFSKSILPLSYIFSKIPDFFVTLGLMLCFYMISGYHPNFSFLLIGIFILPILLFTAGVSLVASLLNAVFRDFGRIVELILMVLFYATPIVYPANLIPSNLQFVLFLNPLASAIIFTRELLFQNSFRADLFLYSLIIGLVTFIIGFIFFTKFEKNMVDII